MRGRRRSRRGSVLVTLALLVAGASVGVSAGGSGLPVLPGDDSDVRVVLDSGRAYVLHVPELLREEPERLQGRPAMLMLHGLDSNPEDAARSTGLSRLADRDGALVAYPEGVRDSFNAGLCCGPAAQHGVDDVDFLTEVVQDLKRRGAGRVSVVGFSNGGMMAYRLACERPGLVDRVGVMSGTLQIPRCDGRITALHIHGERDTAVPLSGDEHSARLGTFLRDVSTIQRASPGSTITYKGLPGFPHRWTVPGDEVDASEEFWRFARMTDPS